MEAVKGRVHSFESFGTLDGPGIRFIVFLQGCPLRCIYCHNRDTWDPKGGKEYSADEVVNMALQYKNYMQTSGGGITITGGEPTLQPKFVHEIFKKCHEKGIHTALDTSGFTELEKVKGLLEETDLVLLDIKHAVEEKHKKIAGVGTEKIKIFSQYLSDNNIPIWIRYVLVPGYTDAEEDLLLAADYISTLKSVERVNVLPYHNLGTYKWEKLGERYELEGVQPPSQERVNWALDILKRGIKK